MTTHTRRTVCLDLNRLSPDPAWPTKRQDLQAAVTILQRHAADGEPLRLLDDWGEAADGERIWVRFPEWRRELVRHYQDRYGNDAHAICAAGDERTVARCAAALNRRQGQRRLQKSRRTRCPPAQWNHYRLRRCIV